MTRKPRRGSKIALLGAGKIGKLATVLLAKDYDVTVFDIDRVKAKKSAAGRGSYAALDVNETPRLRECLKNKRLVISCLPFFCNVQVAKVAAELGISYCDLSEDVATGTAIEKIARRAKTQFIPHCGLAPGFCQIIASHLIRKYKPIDRVSIRVGALPENPTNALKYNLTWSTDGLINEYGNECEVLRDGRLRNVQPLEGYERLIIRETEYEAFNTSGGLGTLARSLQGKVKNLDYKTIRYIGHRDLMKFLMFDLQLNEYREILKRILETAVPTTEKDQVIILVTVVGKSGGSLRQQTYTKIIPHSNSYRSHWTAIQISTASSLAAVVDLCLRGKIAGSGFIRQEDIDYEAFVDTEYGQIFS